MEKSADLQYLGAWDTLFRVKALPGMLFSLAVALRAGLSCAEE